MYRRTRGIDALDAVVGNLREFVPLAHKAGRPHISLWLTAMRENLSELPDLVDLAAELGVAEVYTQRLVLFGEGLATSEQSAHGKLRTGGSACAGMCLRNALWYTALPSVPPA